MRGQIQVSGTICLKCQQINWYTQEVGMRFDLDYWITWYRVLTSSLSLQELHPVTFHKQAVRMLSSCFGRVNN